MIGLLRRLLGIDRFEELAPVPYDEERDRADARRTAQRAKRLAAQLQRDRARRREMTLRLEARRARR